MKQIRPLCVCAWLALLVNGAAGQSSQAPVYKPSRQLSGTIHTWGSPQMGDLLKRYEEGFGKLQPAVRFEDDLKSTVTAVAGVYTGRADIGLLGREIWPVETQAFESIEGHPPTVIEVATGSYDVPKATFALMVFVPQANPLASLSMTQLERIFGNGSRKPSHTWGEAGLTGQWAHRPIHLYGFNVDNDKSQIFAQLVFRKGEHWNGALHEFGNGADGTDAGALIVKAVAQDPDGIGISNVHYASPAVKPLAVAAGGNQPAIAPTKDNVTARRYPLARSVFMVTHSGGDHPTSAAALEFLRFVLSRQGQEAVAAEGNYLPLTGEAAAQQLRMLETTPPK